MSYAEVHASEKVNANMDEYEEENLTYGSTIRQSSTPPRNPENRVSLSHVYAVPFVPKSSTVSMMCFEEYAKEITFSGHLATQYTVSNEQTNENKNKTPRRIVEYHNYLGFYVVRRSLEASLNPAIMEDSRKICRRTETKTW